MAQTAPQLTLGTILFDEHTAGFGAALNDTSDFLYVGNQAVPGLFNNIREIYVSACKTIRNDTRMQNIGLLFSSSKIGELISENKLQLFYSIGVKIDQETEARIGTNVGFINNFMEGTSNVSGGSDLEFDIGLSASLSRPVWKIGLTRNQINSPVLNPLSQSILYGSFYSSFALINVLRTEDFLLQLKHQGIYQKGLNIFRFKSSLTYGNMVRASVMGSNREIAFDLGLVDFQILQIKSRLMFAYQIPIGSATVNSFTPFQVHLRILKE